MHVVLITDKHGDTVECNTYCSDMCAQTDRRYQGWFGCMEVLEDTACLYCGKIMEGVN